MRSKQIPIEDQKFMDAAILQAKKGLRNDEVPIGCVIVQKGKVIARGYNTRTKRKDPMGHAEIMAIKKAFRKIDDFRLSGCTMYVTVEPCILCFGAILQARFKRLVFGLTNPNEGAVGLLPDIKKKLSLNYKLEITKGVLSDESKTLMKSFFEGLRIKKRL